MGSWEDDESRLALYDEHFHDAFAEDIRQERPLTTITGQIQAIRPGTTANGNQYHAIKILGKEHTWYDPAFQLQQGQWVQLETYEKGQYSNVSSKVPNPVQVLQGPPAGQPAQQLPPAPTSGGFPTGQPPATNSPPMEAYEDQAANAPHTVSSPTHTPVQATQSVPLAQIPRDPERISIESQVVLKAVTEMAVAGLFEGDDGMEGRLARMLMHAETFADWLKERAGKG